MLLGLLHTARGFAPRLLGNAGLAASAGVMSVAGLSLGIEALYQRHLWLLAGIIVGIEITQRQRQGHAE